MTQTATTEHVTSVERTGHDVRAYCVACDWKGPRHHGFSAQFVNIDRRTLEIASQDGDAHEKAARS